MSNIKLQKKAQPMATGTRQRTIEGLTKEVAFCQVIINQQREEIDALEQQLNSLTHKTEIIEEVDIENQTADVAKSQYAEYFRSMKTLSCVIN